MMMVDTHDSTRIATFLLQAPRLEPSAIRSAGGRPRPAQRGGGRQAAGRPQPRPPLRNLEEVATPPSVLLPLLAAIVRRLPCCWLLLLAALKGCLAAC
eukprot:COSAG01_NODE_970_length_12375_cov_27.268736_1_plen_98_part_00